MAPEETRETKLKKAIAAVLALVSAGVLADDGKMKPGLWEVKTLRHVMDGRDITAQMAGAQEKAQQALANLPPERRKQLEAMMGGRPLPTADAGGATRVCISPAMAARDAPAVEPKSHCAPQNLTRNGNTTEFEFKCVSEGRTSAGKGKRTVNGDTVDTSVDMTSTDSRGEHKIQNESRMTYLGADCQGIKPLEEIARGTTAPAP